MRAACETLAEVVDRMTGGSAPAEFEAIADTLGELVRRLRSPARAATRAHFRPALRAR
jgi:hypothetical protein